MRLAQYECNGTRFIGLDAGGTWIDYTRARAAHELLMSSAHRPALHTIEAMLEEQACDPSEMKAVALFVRQHKLMGPLSLPKGARLLAPLVRPRKIVALGLNYALHVKEGSFEVPEEPIFFAKAGSSVIGPDEAVLLPRQLGRMDHEVELAVIIGKRASGVLKKRAMDYVAGYTILNDVSARTLQTKDLSRRHPWFRSKSFDTFTPMGPWMVTADEIKTPVHLNLECRVNGKIRQRANTRDLVFDIPTMIEFISRLITLEPGDVISTGTPAGIGPIKGGDTMVCRIEKIGELRNPVRWR